MAKKQAADASVLNDLDEALAKDSDDESSLAGELAQTKDQLLRLAADFDNFRKRSQREREEAFLLTKADVLKAFLPVLDNLDRAENGLEAAEAEDYRKGVTMIFEQLRQILAAQGTEAFGGAGDAFDPALHNAVMHDEDPELGESVVAEVFQKGYRVGDKLLREAVVRVAN
ncbi:MAG: nucleotide exchange factor GrpE [Oscillospiraceae bacterium]|nr:nucleotide exchange factor GrpE [Oscillospiraceae bacterium]